MVAKVGRFLLVAFLVIFMALCALVLLAMLSSATGPLGFLIGTFLALLPLPVVLWAFRWIDRYEPEPPALLAFAFFWGATVAALASATLNTVGGLLIAARSGTVDPGAEVLTTAVYVAPWVEEAAKGAALLAIFLFRRREFDGLVDGIVLGGMVGVGFAFTENILYFGQAFLEGSAALGTAGGISAVGITFLLRGVLSPFAHPLFTVLTGIGFGLAVSHRQPLIRWGAPVVGFLGAVLLHSMWNRSAGGGGAAFFASYVTIMVPIFLVAVAVAIWSRRREGRIVAARLPLYVNAGWLTPADLAMVSSVPARKQALRWAQETHGDEAARELKKFQHVATELAFLRDRAERGHMDSDFVARERRLLREASAVRHGLAR